MGDLDLAFRRFFEEDLARAFASVVAFCEGGPRALGPLGGAGRLGRQPERQEPVLGMLTAEVLQWHIIPRLGCAADCRSLAQVSAALARCVVHQPPHLYFEQRVATMRSFSRAFGQPLHVRSWREAGLEFFRERIQDVPALVLDGEAFSPSGVDEEAHAFSMFERVVRGSLTASTSGREQPEEEPAAALDVLESRLNTRLIFTVDVQSVADWCSEQAAHRCSWVAAADVLESCYRRFGFPTAFCQNEEWLVLKRSTDELVAASLAESATAEDLHARFNGEWLMSVHTLVYNLLQNGGGQSQLFGSRSESSFRLWVLRIYRDSLDNLFRDFAARLEGDADDLAELARRVRGDHALMELIARKWGIMFSSVRQPLDRTPELAELQAASPGSKAGTKPSRALLYSMPLAELCGSLYDERYAPVKRARLRPADAEARPDFGAGRG